MNCRLGITIIVLSSLLFQTSCALKYLGVQGVYQLNMLSGREPISDLIASEQLPASVSERLHLVSAIRSYAREEMAMVEADSYSSANLDWAGVIINVSGCSPTAFQAHTWWFPIVGRVPYLGFFRRADAEKQIDELTEAGLDVASYQVAAYSTLGFFSDPVLPHMLDYDDITLIDLLIHEMAHSILYFKNQADFNESFATFVAHQGLLGFLERHYEKAQPLIKEAEARRVDRDIYHRYMVDLYAQLDEVYQQSLPEATTLAKKAELIAQADAGYDALPLSSERYQGRSLGSLNNAQLMSYRRYHSGSDVFEGLLQAVDGDWRRFFDEVKSVKKAKVPMQALERRLKELVAENAK